MKILQSKLAAFFLLVFLSFILFSLGKAVYRKYQINQEIEKIKEEIARIEGENQKMLDIIEYLKTEEFLEKEAREKLNLGREGEKVIVIPPLKEEREEEVRSELKENEEKKSLSNPERWWNYFFGEEKVFSDSE